MPEDNAKPVSLLITEDIAATLSRVTVENNYHLTLKVQRLNESNHEFNNPAHLLAVVDPDDPELQGNPSEGEDEFIRTYVIHVWVIPSQTDGVPIDEYIDFISADVIKCLCDDESGSYRRNGLAIDTKPGDTIVTKVAVANSIAYVVNVPVDVLYTTRTRNLYRQ